MQDYGLTITPEQNAIARRFIWTLLDVAGSVEVAETMIDGSEAMMRERNEWNQLIAAQMAATRLALQVIKQGVSAAQACLDLADGDTTAVLKVLDKTEEEATQGNYLDERYAHNLRAQRWYLNLHR